MTELSSIGEAIRHYKLNASGGYPEWAKVSCSSDYKLHVPAKGFGTVGPLENEEIIFGWLGEMEAQQDLVNIVEFGADVTCYLRITDKDGGVLDVVEVFKSNDKGEIEEIWAL